MKLTKSAQNTVLRVDETDEVSNHTYGKAKLTWFEEIFEEYKMMGKAGQLVFFDVYRLVRQVS
ncbi:hypothetical protein [Streptococcus pneumoniae]|uniref:hypothetical protein n=1 Tax=Streptococcus pneumoniae TaxID=1313 RepID=UPI00076925C5|nr:hypothetical protein [Streptococcus pneumoniae]CZB73838.1 N-ethylammeline chlorohydrolase [Streptococcus pneumoniae]